MLNSNCYLLGFMGAGKSYTARLLGEYAQLEFVDLDALIEDRAGKSIARIFKEEGEANFRLLEAELLRTTAKNQPRIVALGGGTPMHHQNMTWIKNNGQSIYLDPPFEILIQRLDKEAAKRPLIAQLSPEALKSSVLKRLKERDPVYRQADLHLQSHSQEIILASCLKFLKIEDK